MAGLPVTHTAVGRLCAALQAEKGCTRAEAREAYGPQADEALRTLEAPGIVMDLGTKPKRWKIAYVTAPLRHTELRRELVLGIVKRQGEVGCTVADVQSFMPETQHRVEMALGDLIRSGQVERFRPTEGDRRTPWYRAVQS